MFRRLSVLCILEEVLFLAAEYKKRQLKFELPAFVSNKTELCGDILLYLIDNSCKSFRVVNGKVGKRLAVDLNIRFAECSHQLRIG